MTISELVISLGQLLTGVPVAIANGANVSGIINTKGSSLVGIIIPAAFTSTTITFSASVDGSTFFPVKNTTSGTTLSYTVAPGEYIAINPVDFYGIPYLEINTGSSEAAARTLLASLKGI